MRAHCQVHQGGNTRNTSPSKARLVLPPPHLHQSDHLLCCHSRPMRPGTAPPENKAKKHTTILTWPRLLRDYNQALGFMVVGLSHFSLCSGSQQQVMAHSCLTTVTVKEKDYKTEHKQTSQRTPTAAFTGIQ